MKGNFNCSAFGCAVYEQNIYTLETAKINVRTYQVNAFEMPNTITIDCPDVQLWPSNFIDKIKKSFGSQFNRVHADMHFIFFY
jgi:hypothetical protein